MCDEDNFKALERRVDKMETRLTKLETSVADSREENKKGFDALHIQLNQIYAEKQKWGDWVRASVNLPSIGKFVGKWTAILTGAAIGFNNLPNISKFITGFGGAQ